jgi:predicted ATP-grasp superfamily ATP-dependent carboligase
LFLLSFLQDSSGLALLVTTLPFTRMNVKAGWAGQGLGRIFPLFGMRVFIYEHTCASASPGLEALQAEGRAMLSAVVADFARLHGVEVLTWNDGLEEPLRRLAAEADYTLMIAPEIDGILETRCRWVEEAGGRLLGPSSAAVKIAADKWRLGELWRQRRVPTPPCRLLLPQETPPDTFFPAVCKPRFGAGSQATFLVRNAADVREMWRQARAEGYDDATLLQSFVPGRPASVAWIIGSRQQVPLLPAEQDLSDDGRFHYRGGAVPLGSALTDRAVRLTRSALEAIPGLLGYVGVDIVLGEASDGSQDQVIEVNPRLTTSYIGVRALARSNLAEMMLEAASGRTLTEPGWRPGRVRFQADGQVFTE